jgi:hypothetical protein
MLNNGIKYHYAKLNQPEKRLYNKMHEALSRQNPSLTLNTGLQNPIALIDVQKVINFILLDNPAFFHLYRERIEIEYRPMSLRMSFLYIYNKTEARFYVSDIKRVLTDFTKQADQITDTLTKQLYIYKHLQKTIKPVYTNTNHESHSVIGALLRNACVCEGFAKAYKMLCDVSNIPSIILSGEAVRDGKPELHAWNITQIGGTAAHCDVTWDAINTGSSFTYFNLPDFEIKRDHTWDENLYPVCPPNDINYFTQNRLIARSDDEARKIIERNAANKVFSIKLTFPATLDSVSDLGFPAGTITFNETQNVVTFSAEE